MHNISVSKFKKCNLVLKHVLKEKKYLKQQFISNVYLKLQHH